MDTFSGFFDKIPFFSRTEQELLYYLLFTTALLFQLRENNVGGEEISEKMILKQGYSKLNEDSMPEAKYFMSCTITSPVSETIVEPSGSVIDTSVSNKVDFKDSDAPNMIDITETCIY